MFILSAIYCRAASSGVPFYLLPEIPAATAVRNNLLFVQVGAVTDIVKIIAVRKKDNNGCRVSCRLDLLSVKAQDRLAGLYSISFLEAELSEELYTSLFLTGTSAMDCPIDLFSTTFLLSSSSGSSFQLSAAEKKLIQAYRDADPKVQASVKVMLLGTESLTSGTGIADIGGSGAAELLGSLLGSVKNILG